MRLRRFKRIGASETTSEMAHRATVRISELKKGGRHAHEKRGSRLRTSFLWALTDSNRRPSACKADALNQLS